MLSELLQESIGADGYQHPRPCWLLHEGVRLALKVGMKAPR